MPSPYSVSAHSKTKMESSFFTDTDTDHFFLRRKDMLDPADFYRALREIEPASVEELVRKALADGHSPPEILNDGLIAGMALIGQEFKARELWVPDVLLAARNMKQGIEILKPLFSREGQKTKGKVVLGTVKGDIHDIGKNLVAIMMSGFGSRGHRPGSRRSRGEIHGLGERKPPASSGFPLSSPPP